MTYQSLIENNKEKTLYYIKNHWGKIILLLVFFILIYYYFRSIYRRIPRYLYDLKNNLKNIEIKPLTSCPKLISNKYKLCDFYISSSAKSYIPCMQYYDYSSLESIKMAILNGARYIELDIFNKGFCEDTIPIVTNGQVKGNWHWTSELTFDSCCSVIFDYAFSNIIPNNEDPFFLALNLNLDYNCKTADKVADILRTYFNSKFLGINYSYQRTNIALVSIDKFIGKLIILSNQRCQDSKLGELINYTWDQPFMRSYSHYELQDSYEPRELSEYNKKNLTRVYPGFKTRKTENYNPRLGWLYGCQFVALNFTNFDDNMKVHFLKFGNSSFMLKPYQLRYHPEFYKKPTPQTKRVSFAPEQISTPYYSITY